MVLNVNITMLYKKYCSLQPLNFTYKQTVILLLISQVDNSTNMSHTQQYLYELGLIWVACIGRYLLKLRNLWTVNVRRTLLLEQLEVVKNSKNGEDLSYWCPMERITNCWLSFIYIKKKLLRWGIAHFHWIQRETYDIQRDYHSEKNWRLQEDGSKGSIEEMQSAVKSWKYAECLWSSCTFVVWLRDKRSSVQTEELRNRLGHELWDKFLLLGRSKG